MRNSRRANHLLFHTLLFLVIHIVLYLFIHSRFELSEGLEQLRLSITGGKSGYYHSQSGVYIVTLWAVLYAIDVFSYLFQSLISKKNGEHLPQQQASMNEGVGDVKTQSLSVNQTRYSPATPKHIAPLRSGWIYLLLGGVFEISWVFLLKVNMLGGPLLLIFIFSFHFIVKASKSLPIGTVYAVFTGFGAVGTIILDITIFGEAIQPIKLGLVVMLVMFIMLLKRSSQIPRKD